MILNSPYISGSLTVTGTTVLSGSVTLASGASIAGTAATASSVANLVQNVRVTGSLTVSGSSTIVGTMTATKGVFGTSGTGTFGVHITDNDQSNVRLRLTNTGTGGQAFSVVGGNPGLSNSGLAIYDETNSATRMYISASGNIGIGTIDPTAKLYVTGSTTNYGITSENPSGFGGLTLKQTSGNSYAIGLTTNNLFFFDVSAGATRMTLTNSGSLGIGTTSPTSLLEVQLNQNAQTGIRVRNATSGTSAGVEFGAYTNSGNGGFGKYSTGNTPYKNIVAASTYIYNGSSGDIALLNDVANGNISFAAGAASSAQMTLTSGGNVGVGITPPSWFSGYRSLQVSYASLYNDVGLNTYLATNTYIASDGNFKYTINGAIGLSGIEGGSWVFYNAGSGTAGNTATVTERVRMTTGGQLRFSNVPTDNYQVDSSIAISVASGGTISFPIFSGLVIVNNMSNGVCAMWLCGAGTTSLIGQSNAGTPGSLAYSGAINGYVWTSTFGSTANYGVFAVRTRNNA